MKDTMQLSAERNRIFNSHYAKIVMEAKKCYSKNHDFDDLLQIMLMNYVKALKKADIEQNFHAYCMRYAQWACYKELASRKAITKHHCFYEDFNAVLDYDYSLDNVFYNNSIENEVSLEDCLCKIISLRNNLKPVEKTVVDNMVLGNTTPLIEMKIKIRRQQMIAKEFKENVRDVLDAA